MQLQNPHLWGVKFDQKTHKSPPLPGRGRVGLDIDRCITGSTGVKFVNALNKPPLKLYRLVIKDSAHSNNIESVSQQWRESAPPILSTSHCEFNGAVRAPTLEKPSPWHQFTRLLNKWYLHCIQNRWLEACPDRFPQFFAGGRSRSKLCTKFQIFQILPKISNFLTLISNFKLISEISKFLKYQRYNF